MAEQPTLAAEADDQTGGAAHLIVTPYYRDPDTGELYVHNDLSRARGPWEHEDHIPPAKGVLGLGDVESFAAYMLRYGSTNALMTWNKDGIKAVLDYHNTRSDPEADGGPWGRCQWEALFPFVLAYEWLAWTKFANGSARPVKEVVEFMEMHFDDIQEPLAVDLLEILRGLRVNVQSNAETTIRPDGTTAVAFSQDKRVDGPSAVALPPEVRIAIPVLFGHMDANRFPVRYERRVLLRASVDGNAHLLLRFSLQNAERVLEEVYQERVQAAKELLAGFEILRAAD